MQQQCSAPRLQAVLEQIGAWVLDQPLQPELRGQCCDRLRPAQVHRDLQAALARCAMDAYTLVEWRWDARQGRVQRLALAERPVAAFPLVSLVRPANTA